MSPNREKPRDMNREFPEQPPVNDVQSGPVYYTQGSHSATRRQQKHELWLTFVNNTNVPKRKHNPKKASVRPSLLRSLLSMFL